MSSPLPADHDLRSLSDRKRYLARIREEIASQRKDGVPGLAATRLLSDRLDVLIRAIVEQRLEEAKVPDEAPIAVLMTGGNGRRRPAPYSDLDMLIAVDPACPSVCHTAAEQIIRDLWDCGLEPGISIRDPQDILRFFQEDAPFATSLLEMRLLVGSIPLTNQLAGQITNRLRGSRSNAFIDACVAARREEWSACGDSVNQLEPDVKKSPGGLRDIQLLRWIAIARYGAPQPERFLRDDSISEEEWSHLLSADRFLTTLRLDLQNAANMKQDVLSRDMQIRLIGQPEHTTEEAMAAVEQFMHGYFARTSGVAEITRRLIDREKTPSLLSRLKTAVTPIRTPAGTRLIGRDLHIRHDALASLIAAPVDLLEVFAFAADRGYRLDAGTRHAVKEAVPELPAVPDRAAGKAFRNILRDSSDLTTALRSLYETGLLEWLIPEFREVRCLIQFNQYHSFTVDEHTLRAVAEVVRFSSEDSPVGTACRSLRHRATLMLAVLLHDIGKGRDGDHSEVGAEMAEQIAVRLQMAEHKKRMLVFLVRHHLILPNIAFRRDITDPTLLIELARLIGAPELMRMLYVLTVADIRAVGPDVWSDWKGELLAELYDRVMQLISGRPYNHLEQERLEKVREHVRNAIAPLPSGTSDDGLGDWIGVQLDKFPPYYLMTEDPERIARDMDVIRRLDSKNDVRIEGAYDEETDTVTYRVFISAEREQGAFHKLVGILSGLRMNILVGQACTNVDDSVICFFRVEDNDFVGSVPRERIDSVIGSLTDVLRGELTVDSIFRRSALFRRVASLPVLAVPPRISVDNDCSRDFTVIDVFATDIPGLLYTLALTLHESGLSVEFARIATHVDQIVDVFYVVDENHRKLTDPEQLQRIEKLLMQEIRLLGRARPEKTAAAGGKSSSEETAS